MTVLHSHHSGKPPAAAMMSRRYAEGFHAG
jgi:hypothetical protein